MPSGQDIAGAWLFPTGHRRVLRRETLDVDYPKIRPPARDAGSAARQALVVAAAFGIVAGVAAPAPHIAPAQPTTAAAGPPATDTAGEACPPREALERLVAPIALHPDALLGQVLVASTYPLEVVQAARWVADADNAKLRGDALARALEAQPWDPSPVGGAACPEGRSGR